MAKTEQMTFFASRNRRILAFQRCPELLAEDLLILFGLIKTDEDKGKHNLMVKKIIELCPNLDRLLLNIAKAILKTAKENQNDKGS